MSDKQKIGVVISSPLYLRSWFDTGILHSLAEKVELFVFIPNNDEFLAHALKEFNLRKILLPTNQILELSAIVNWIENLRVSKSFLFRYKRILLGDKLWIQKSLKKNLSSFLKGTSHLVSICFTKPHYLLFRIPPLRRLVQGFIDRFGTKKISSIESHLSDLDWLLIPNFAFDRFLEPLIRLCKRVGVKSFVVLDNWDNLTSKLVFRTSPDKINIVGSKSLKFAKTIHNIEEPVAAVIGLPRFEPYKTLRASSAETVGATPEILYVGDSMPWLEIEHVNRANDLIKSILSSNTGVHFTYRPHPAGPVKNFSLLRDGISCNPIDENERLQFGGLPRLGTEYFKDLIAADLVIGPPTTFLVEALVFGRPVILDAREDGEFRTSPGLLLRNYEHMSQLQELRNLPIARSDNDLEQHLKSFFSGTLAQVDRADLGEFIYLGSADFGTLLYREVTKASPSYSA